MPDTLPTSASIVFHPLRGRPLTALVLLLNLLVFGLSGLAIYSSHQYYLEMARTEAKNLSQVIKQSIDGELEKIDAVLYSSKIEIEQQLASGHVDQSGLNRYLALQRRIIPHADSLRAASAAGDILYGTNLHHKIVINIADRDYFKIARDNPDSDFIISETHVGRTTGKQVIVLARRINNPDGSFSGVVFAPITRQILYKFLSSLDLGPKGSVSLRKGFSDLAIIVRHPENMPGTSTTTAGNPRHSPQFAEVVARGEKHRVYEAETGVDGIYRTFSVRRLDKYNYYVGVGLAHDDVFAGWRSEAVKLLAITCVFLVSTILLAWRQHEAWRRQKAAYERLQAIALLDGLTGIPNRRRFDETLEEEWLRARREQQPISLIMADIDHFKAYNDHHGHVEGDTCLKRIAMALHSAISRPGDLVARYGGEEFVLLLPNTDMRGAFDVAERVRQLIQALHIKHGFSSVSDWVTISAGIATMVPGQDDELSTLIAKADSLLYKAKQAGRNRVCSDNQ